MDIFNVLAGGCYVTVGIMYTQLIPYRTKKPLHGIMGIVVSGSFFATGINFIIGNNDIGEKMLIWPSIFLLGDVLLTFKC
jgi:hypothetical protein